MADEDGLPLAGAAVVINYIVDEHFRVRWTETSTDAQGRYEMDFEAMRNGYYRIIGLTDVVAEGMRTSTRERMKRTFSSLRRRPQPSWGTSGSSGGCVWLRAIRRPSRLVPATARAMVTPAWIE